MSKIIELKIAPTHFADVRSGRKKAELRKNDRDFAVDDILILREWENGEYTGEKVYVIITHILQNCGFGLVEGYAILSFEILGGGAK